MSSKKSQKTSYAISEDKAISVITESNQLKKRAENLLKQYLCEDPPLRYKEKAVPLLAEYMTNSNFYSELMESILFSDNRIEDKASGKENIMISDKDFELIMSYIAVTAACENELETVGISMRLH